MINWAKAREEDLAQQLRVQLAAIRARDAVGPLRADEYLLKIPRDTFREIATLALEALMDRHEKDTAA